MHKTILSKTIRAGRSVFLVAITKLIVQFFAQLILVRMLAPEIFGIFVFSQIIITFFSLFSTIHGQKSVVREGEESKELYDVVFTIELIIGLLTTTLIFVSSGFVSRILGRPETAVYIRALSILILINIFIVSPRALLERELEFRKANFSTFIGIIVSAIISVVLALSGFKIWALILGVISGSLTEAIVLWRTLPYRPQLKISDEAARKAIRFGLPLTLSGIIAFLYSNVDKFMVGKFLGDKQLGFYWFAFSIPHFLFAFISNIETVVFPAFAKLKNIDLIMNGFKKYTKLSAIFFIIPSCLILASGSQIIIYIFGKNWLPALFPLKVFILVAAIRGIFVSPWSAVYLNKGHSLVFFYMSLINLIFIVTFGYLLINRYGIISMSLVILGVLIFCLPLVKLTLRSIFKFSYLRILIPQIFIFFLCFIAANLITKFINDLISLISACFLLTFFFIGALYIFDRDIFLWIKKYFINLILKKQNQILYE